MADMAGSFQSILQKVCLSPGCLKTTNSQLTHSGLVLPPSPTITQHRHINQNINNGITPRPPLPSQQAGSQYIIVVPLSAGTKVIRILLMSVPSLPGLGFCCPRPSFLPLSRHSQSQCLAGPADKWSSKVSSPPSPFNGVQTIEKLNQLSPVQIHPTPSCHVPPLSLIYLPFSLIFCVSCFGHLALINQP